MNNQKAHRFVPNFLLLIERFIPKKFSLSFLSDRAAQKTESYLLKPQYIFVQQQITLLDNRKQNWLNIKPSSNPYP